MSDPQNNFKIFNEANNSEKTMSDSDYATDTYRLQGLTPMMANPKAHNKMFRQWSIMCKAILNNDSALKWKTKKTDSKEENLSTTSNDSMADLILDASKSNSIYGKNWTVTPQNISFNTYIKL